MTFAVPARRGIHSEGAVTPTSMTAFAHRIVPGKPVSASTSFVVGSGGLNLRSDAGLQLDTSSAAAATGIAGRNKDVNAPLTTSTSHFAKQLVLVVSGESGGAARFAVTNGLTAKGKRQAETTGKYLESWLRSGTQVALRNRITALVSGPGDAATQTATLILHAMISADDLFGLHHVDARTVDPNIEQRMDPRLAEIVPADGFRTFPGSHTATAEVVDALMTPFSTDIDGPALEVVVMSATLVKLCLCRALQLPAAAYEAFEVLQGSITIINVELNGSCRIVCSGAVTHLSPADA